MNTLLPAWILPFWILSAPSIYFLVDAMMASKTTGYARHDAQRADPVRAAPHQTSRAAPPRA